LEEQRREFEARQQRANAVTTVVAPVDSRGGDYGAPSTQPPALRPPVSATNAPAAAPSSKAVLRQLWLLPLCDQRAANECLRRLRLRYPSPLRRQLR
jgi:hypothetical protein